METGKLVKLRNSDLEAWISPDHGAAIARLFEPKTGFQILRETSHQEIANGETMKFGCFPMVPYSNRMGYRQLRFEDTIYQLDSNREGAPHSFHGNAWMVKWEVEHLGPDTLTLSYAHCIGDGHWPFPYLARQSLTLDGSTFRLSISIENTGPHPFPAGAGWHPFFRIEPDSRISFEADKIFLNDQDMLPHASMPAIGGWSFGSGRAVSGLGVDNCFSGWSGTALLEHPAAGRAVSITGCDTLSSLVVFRPSDGRQFIAVEPVSHVNNGANLMAQGCANTGIRVLKPSESMSAVMEITVGRS
ncbi:aldose 1-epimerase [Noviherbaspirillum saxi]|uniref:Aldose 1-epimerase n=1 Tax=Noviherbaspirillum saxi TaxID=2320863 RepID=A0A3A3FI42_9BURK|nr:aldose 1-epimerase [Noviherbaspirillum saxi]RJF92184.1 aldose 1-epimerase [Noviherbaspirillum saxi]